MPSTECAKRTVVQLRREAKTRRLKGYSRMRKAQLCNALGYTGATTTRKRKAATTKKRKATTTKKRKATTTKKRKATTTKLTQPANLCDLTVVALRKVARQRKLKGYGRMRKAQLCAALASPIIAPKPVPTKRTPTRRTRHGTAVAKKKAAATLSCARTKYGTLVSPDVLFEPIYLAYLGYESPMDCVFADTRLVYDLVRDIYAVRVGSKTYMHELQKHLKRAVADCTKAKPYPGYLIFHFHIQARDWGHANVIIYVPRTKTLELYDPWGSTASLHRAKFKTHLRQLFNDVVPVRHMITPADYCPLFRGEQSRWVKDKLAKKARGTRLEAHGLCVLWTLHYIQERLKIPSSVSMRNARNSILQSVARNARLQKRTPDAYLIHSMSRLHKKAMRWFLKHVKRRPADVKFICAMHSKTLRPKAKLTKHETQRLHTLIEKGLHKATRN